MDADTLKPSLNLAQHELDKSRADWSAEKLRRSAGRDRPIAEDDGLNKSRPDPSEKAKAVWQGEGGRAAGDRPLPPLYPKRQDSSWPIRGAQYA